MRHILIAAAWVWGVASLPSRSPAPLAGLGRTLFWILLFSHLLVAIAGYETLREAPGSLVLHVARTLLWGRIHLAEIETGQA
jgi:hypothetical protein